MTSEPEELRFLVLGKAGSGKSKTGNTILGADMFAVDICFEAVTTECELRHKERMGKNIEIMDSPGLFDVKRTHEDISIDIVKAVACMHPGPHAILYVIPLGRYSPEEYAVYTRLKALFDEDLTRYLVVVFTGGDRLKPGQSIEELLVRAPPELRKVLQECGHRYIVFNNMAADPSPQVQQLFNLVTKLNFENKFQPYKCPKYTAIGQTLEAEVTRRLAEVEEQEVERTASMQELRRQTEEAKEAVDRVRDKFQSREKEREEEMRRQEEDREERMQRMQRTLEERQLSLEQRREEESRLREELEKERRVAIQTLEEQRKQQREELSRRETEWQRRREAEQKEERKRQEERDRHHRQMLREAQRQIASSSSSSSAGWFQTMINVATTVVGVVLTKNPQHLDKVMEVMEKVNLQDVVDFFKK